MNNYIEKRKNNPFGEPVETNSLKYGAEVSEYVKKYYGEIYSLHENGKIKYDNDILNRYQTQKNKLIQEGFGDYGNTEDEIMDNLGYLKIYNSGNLRFRWIKS